MIYAVNSSSKANDAKNPIKRVLGMASSNAIVNSTANIEYDTKPV
jgi:hypothetical protein